MPISVKITDSNRKDKKYMAIFRLHKGGRIFKITHFGGKNYSDYTKIKMRQLQNNIMNSLRIKQINKLLSRK